MICPLATLKTPSKGAEAERPGIAACTKRERECGCHPPFGVIINLCYRRFPRNFPRSLFMSSQHQHKGGTYISATAGVHTSVKDCPLELSLMSS